MPAPAPLTLDQAVALARSHQFNRRLDEAAAVWRHILAAHPTRVDFLNELAMLTGQLGNLPEAQSLLQRAVDLSPGYLPAWHNLAVAAERQHRQDEALAYLQRAAAIAPAHADTRFRLAQAHKRLGQLDDALRELRVSLDLNPNDPEARGLHANLLLLHGDFPRGWDEYEVRWQCPSFPDTRHPWSTDLRITPDTDLAGRRITLVTEQGFGDTIMFARYVPLLTQRNAHVTLVAPPDLAPLLHWLPHPLPRITSSKTLPKDADHTLPLMSLPRAFQTTLDSIPNTTPYLTVPTHLIEKWRTKIEAALPKPTDGIRGSSNLKVGLAWAGRPQHKHDLQRSLPLSAFLPLAAVPSVTLFSLQKGPASAQANPPPQGLRLTNLTAGLADFADTAALIANLDLVIAVDTAVVHLAGALGKPVWTLLPYVPDFRWLLHRPDSPWYPTMRLFRQPAPGDWPPVLAHVADALHALTTHPPHRGTGVSPV